MLGQTKVKASKTASKRYQILVKSIVFTLLWWSLVAGTLSSWVIGILVVPFAVWLSIILYQNELQKTHNTATMSFVGLVKFLPFFAWQSLCGGWQTALLAIRSRVAPAGFIEFETVLNTRREKVMFMHVVSLMPGSVSANITNQTILIHILDLSEYSEDSLRDCEHRISKIFIKPDPLIGAQK